MTRCLPSKINILCRLEASLYSFSCISFMATTAHSNWGQSSLSTRQTWPLNTAIVCDVTKWPWHTNTGFQDGVVLGLFLSFRCTPALSLVRALLHLMVACDHHGYRDSGSTQQHVWIAKLPVPQWYVGYRTLLAATLSMMMYEGSVIPWGVPQTASLGSVLLQVMNNSTPS